MKRQCTIVAFRQSKQIIQFCKTVSYSFNKRLKIFVQCTNTTNLHQQGKCNINKSIIMNMVVVLTLISKSTI